MEIIVVKVGNVIEWEMVCIIKIQMRKEQKIGRKRRKYLISLLIET